MKTIKIKVKYILLILLLLSTITVNKEIVKISTASFYNRYAPENYKIDITSMATSTIDGESSRLAHMLSEQNYGLFDLVTISGGATSMHSHIRTESGDHIYEAYLAFNEEMNILKDYPDYYLDVILTQWFSGHVDRSLEMMAAVEPEALDETTYEHYQIIKLGIDLTYGNLDSALTILDTLDSDGFARTSNSIRLYMAEFFDMDVAYVDSKDLPHSDFDNRYYSYLSIFNGIADRYLFPYQPSNNSNTTQDSIRGYITYNGEPFTNLFIYEDYRANGMSSLEGFSSSFYRPDANGYYDIPALNAQTESIGFMVPWQFIHNKQYSNSGHYMSVHDYDTFDFTINDGAYFSELYIEEDQLYYQILDSASNPSRDYSVEIRFVDSSYDRNGTRIVLTIPHNEMKGSLDLTQIKNEIKAPYLYSSGNVTYERLIEPLYLSGDYYFSLSIINNNDKDYYISNALFSDVLAYKLYVPGSEPSQGDLYLQEGSIEAAIEWFEANPSIHSAKILSALYTRGYIEEENVDWQPWDLGGINLDKAAYYNEQLIAYGVNDSLTLGSLSQIYADMKDYNNERRILEEHNTLYPTKYIDFDLAKNAINRGIFMEGVNSYTHSAESNVDDDRYMHYILVANLVNLLPNRYLELLEAIDRTDYEPMFEQILLGNYNKAWTFLSQMPESDIKDFYQILMLESFDTELINYKTFTETVEGYSKSEHEDTRISYYRYVADLLNTKEARELLKMLKSTNGWF